MRAAPCIVGAIALTLSGCGSQEDAKADAAKAACSAAPVAKGPDEVTGIRMGMDLAAVKTLLKCRDGGFRFNEDGGGFPIPALPDGKRPVTKLIAQRGKIAGCDPADPETLKACVAEDPSFTHVDERVHVYFAGMPGAEKVIAVMREVSFADDKKQASAPISRELVAKYGAQPDVSSWGSTSRIAWIFDGRGQRMSPANQDFPLCRDAAGFGSDAPSHLRPGCHLTVTAWVSSSYDKPEIADGYGVAMVDQDAASKAIDDTTARIGAAADAQRKAVSEPTAIEMNVTL